MANHRPKSLNELNQVYDKALKAQRAIKEGSQILSDKTPAPSKPSENIFDELQQQASQAKKSELYDADIANIANDFIKRFTQPEKPKAEASHKELKRPAPSIQSLYHTPVKPAESENKDVPLNMQPSFAPSLSQQEERTAPAVKPPTPESIIAAAMAATSAPTVTPAAKAAATPAETTADTPTVAKTTQSDAPAVSEEESKRLEIQRSQHEAYTAQHQVAPTVRITSTERNDLINEYKRVMSDEDDDDYYFEEPRPKRSSFWSRRKKRRHEIEEDVTENEVISEAQSITDIPEVKAEEHSDEEEITMNLYDYIEADFDFVDDEEFSEDNPEDLTEEEAQDLAEDTTEEYEEENLLFDELISQQEEAAIEENQEEDPAKDEAEEPEEDTYPTEPEEGTYPTEPEEETYPTEPEEGTYPTEPEEGTYPTEPEEGAYPTEPEEGAYPTEPEEGTYPTEPEEGTYPTEPEEGTYPTEPEEDIIYPTEDEEETIYPTEEGPQEESPTAGMVFDDIFSVSDESKRSYTGGNWTDAFSDEPEATDDYEQSEIYEPVEEQTEAPKVKEKKIRTKKKGGKGLKVLLSLTLVILILCTIFTGALGSVVGVNTGKLFMGDYRAFSAQQDFAFRGISAGDLVITEDYYAEKGEAFVYVNHESQKFMMGKLSTSTYNLVGDVLFVAENEAGRVLVAREDTLGSITASYSGIGTVLALISSNFIVITTVLLALCLIIFLALIIPRLKKSGKDKDVTVYKTEEAEAQAEEYENRTQDTEEEAEMDEDEDYTDYDYDTDGIEEGLFSGI